MRRLLGVCVGVERGTTVLSSAGGSLPFCLSGSSQLGLTRRRMRAKPFGAISCIPDGASPASTLALLACRATAPAMPVLGIIHNARRARRARHGMPCLLPIRAIACLPACQQSADHKHPLRDITDRLPD